MKIEFVLKCGCTAIHTVDQFERSDSVLTVISRIYGRPYNTLNNAQHKGVEYIKITQGRTKCLEHFPKEVKKDNHKCCHCHCERDCD